MSSRLPPALTWTVDEERRMRRADRLFYSLMTAAMIAMLIATVMVLKTGRV